MNLVKTSEAHLYQLLTWVTDEAQLIKWAGPNMRYPSDAKILAKDLYSNGWPGYSLVSNDQQLLGFGQYYERLERCHLCRLIVSPQHRGKRIVQSLIQMIAAIGMQKLGVKSCSLFVYHNNLSALKAYEKMGFTATDYPTDDGMDACLYMVKTRVLKPN